MSGGSPSIRIGSTWEIGVSSSKLSLPLTGIDEAAEEQSAIRKINAINIAERRKPILELIEIDPFDI
tara:strand:+ start:139 stop:339 length:201 start_codon:yes stop_codon:yes gene_type:complete